MVQVRKMFNFSLYDVNHHLSVYLFIVCVFLVRSQKPLQLSDPDGRTNPRLCCCMARQEAEVPNVVKNQTFNDVTVCSRIL